MERPAYEIIAALAEAPEAVERSIRYVQQNMGRFLKKREKVLLCFPKKENAACRILEQAVLGCECIPVWLGDDQRWMSILKKAFGIFLLIIGVIELKKCRPTQT